MPANIFFSLPKKFRGRSSAKTDGAGQPNQRNASKLIASPSVTSRNTTDASSSQSKEFWTANSRGKADAAAVPGNNVLSVRSHKSSKTKVPMENVGGNNSNKSAILSTSRFDKSNNKDDDDECHFSFPSFDKTVDSDMVWMDDGGDAQQQQQQQRQQQCNQTCTTCSISISGSHNDEHMEVVDDNDDEGNNDEILSNNLAWGYPSLFTEEGSADPPAILLDLDEDETIFDTNSTVNEEDETEKKEEEPGKKLTMFFMQNDVRDRNPCKNDFWLSSSSSSSFFGLSLASHTQSKDNDEESCNTNPLWEQGRMNHHQPVVSPSPSPSAKIQSTSTTAISTTATRASAITSPKHKQEEDDLAAWGEIISAIKKSPTESMSDPQHNLFGDSFFNYRLNSINSNLDDQEEPDNDNHDHKDDDRFAIMNPMENSSVGSDDAIFFSVANPSGQNNVNVISHDEKNKRNHPLRNKRESGTDIDYIPASSWEDKELSLLDTSFNYSLSNEDPPAVVEGSEKHCNSNEGRIHTYEGHDDVGGDSEMTTAIVAASAGGGQDTKVNEHKQGQPQAHHQQHQNRHRRRRMHPSSFKGQHEKLVDISTLSYDADIQFLLSNLEATIGPRGVAPDMESLSGRSVRSARPARSDHGQHHHHHHHQTKQYNDSTTEKSFVSRRGDSSSGSNIRQHYSPSGGASIDSRASRSSKASRKSYRSHHSTRSALTCMSKETRTVANDLFRLEAQIADQVARQQRGAAVVNDGVALKSNGGSGSEVIQLVSSEETTSSTSEENDISAHTQPLGAAPAPRPNTHFELEAPPGKLGILLSNVKTRNHERVGGMINKHSNKILDHKITGPTHVSSVRSTSVLAGRVHVGDIFLSIDGEDVTTMNSLQITSIMARKSDSIRVLRLQPLVNSTAAQWQEWI